MSSEADETKRRGYLLFASAVVPSDLDATRRMLLASCYLASDGCMRAYLDQSVDAPADVTVSGKWRHLVNATWRVAAA